jgi:DNA mismatch repair protein MSH6
MNTVVEETKNGPWFTQPEHITDAMERRPDDPNYDPSTVFIPEIEWKKFTPGMHRYWEIKAKNFDKVVFYRFGQWFIVYYQDADICHKHLDLCIPPR